MATALDVAFVSYPDAPLTEELVTGALRIFYPSLSTVNTLPDNLPEDARVLQWSAYDGTNHARTLANPRRTLASSYTIRKLLIRKHFLHHWVSAHVAKTPESVLAVCCPRTWDVDISWADELEELWHDDLYELGTLLEAGDKGWFIVKPGMADRGMGIRLFNNKDGLREIFESFEEAEEEEDEVGNEDEDHEDDTRVLASQLRHFVLQEYLNDPVLIDPGHVHINNGESLPSTWKGHKFHLRVYCVAAGALTVYFAPRMLALFAGEPYTPPTVDTAADLGPHLTNTCLQTGDTQRSVRELAELSGARYGGSRAGTLAAADLAAIEDAVADVLAETFRAALASPVHFQPLPNAFELFGADILLTHAPDGGFRANLLELNAEPAIEQTGPRLRGVLEELFAGIASACVVPFFDSGGERQAWAVGETRAGLRKCLEAQVRAQGAW